MSPRVRPVGDGALRRGETIEYNRDKGIGVTIYAGSARATPALPIFLPGLKDTVEAALAIARFTAEDDCAGLAELGELACDCPDLALHHPGICRWKPPSTSPIAASRPPSTPIPDQQFRRGDETTQEAQFVAANSLGFGGYPTSRHYIACSVIAGEQDEMQRDDWYSTTRRLAGELDSAGGSAPLAAERAVARLGGRKVKTAEVPVLSKPARRRPARQFCPCRQRRPFTARRPSWSIIWASGFSRNSWNIGERPFIARGLGSAFDNDGVATRDREVVRNGVPKAISSERSHRPQARPEEHRQRRRQPQSHHRTGERDFAGPQAHGARPGGHRTLGHGINYVTGDYSRGAAGFWVENGEIAYPVEEITIAGNLKAMFAGIVAVGNDVLAAARSRRVRSSSTA